MKALSNNKGFSLTQVMVGLGISGILSLAIMKQISTSQKSQATFEKKQAIDRFMDRVSRQFATKKVCDINFAGGPTEKSIETLLSSRPGTAPNSYAPILQVGEEYLGRTFRVDSMALSDASEGPESKARLSITFKKLGQDDGYDIVKKEIVFPAKISGDVIQSCYYDFAQISEDLMSELAQSICEGMGAEVDANDNCQFKSFDQSNLDGLNCPPGEALTQLTMDPSTYVYNYYCNPVLNYNSASCPTGLVKSVTNSGDIVCLAPATLIDPTTSQVANGSSCGLQLQAGKLKLVCSGGAPAPSFNIFTCTTSGWSQGATCASEGVLCGSTATVSPDDTINSLCCGSTPTPTCEGASPPPPSGPFTYTCNVDGWDKGASCSSAQGACALSGNSNDGDSLCCDSAPTRTCGLGGSGSGSGSGSSYPKLCATFFRCHLGKESKTDCYLQSDGSINRQLIMNGISCSDETPYVDDAMCRTASACNL